MSASAANAGNVYIDFQAETAKFSAGVEKVNAKLDEFGKKAAEGSGAAESMFPELLGAELVKDALEKIGEAAIEAAHKIVEFVSEMVDADVKATRMASSLGMSVGALQGLQSAAKIGAGVDAEAFAHALEHMGVSLAKATTAGGEAKEALDRLGLSAKEMRSASPDQAFLKIAQSLSEVGNTYDRIKIADDIFGARQAKELLPLLAQGADGIQKFIDGAKEAGVVISDVDASKVLEAGMATAELKESFEGIFQQLTIAVAPAIKTVGEYIKGWIPNAETTKAVFDKIFEYAAPAAQFIGDTMKVGFEAVKLIAHEIGSEVSGLVPSVDSVGKAFDVATQFAVEGIGAMLDAGKTFKIGFLGYATAVAAGIEFLTIPISEVIDGLVWIYNHMPGDDQIQAPDLTAKIDAMREKLGQMTKDAAKGPWPHEAIDEFYDHLRKSHEQTHEAIKKDSIGKGEADDFYEARKELKKLMDESQKKIDTFGMNEIDKKLYDLHEKFGKLPPLLQAQVDQHLKPMSKLLDQLEEDKKAVEEIKRMADEGKTSWEKWNDQVQKMGDLLKRQKITQQQYDLAKKKADEEYQKSMHGGDEKQAAAMVRRFDFRMISQQNDDPLVALGKQQVEVLGNLKDIMGQVQTNTAKDANVANFN